MMQVNEGRLDRCEQSIAARFVHIASKTAYTMLLDVVIDLGVTVIL